LTSASANGHREVTRMLEQAGATEGGG